MELLDIKLEDEAVAAMLNSARRYRVLAANTHDAETAIEFEYLALLFEAQVEHGTGLSLTLQ
jgi:hypothetical protein